MRLADEIDFTMAGPVDFVGDDTRVRMTYRAFPDVEPGQQVDLISFDDVDYVRARGEAKWTKTETTTADEVANSMDVPSSLASLGAITDEVQAHGPEQLDGVATTRYTAKVDIARVPDTLPPEDADRYREFTDGFRDKELPAEIWIDSKGLIRRIRYELRPETIGIPGRSGMLTLAISLDDLGEPVRVAPPPARLTVAE